MQQHILNNRYQLEQKLGEGGMARVYLGRDVRLNRSVAVKVLHSHYASDPNFLSRFHHEAQAAANLRHPSIVDVYDVGQDGDMQYIVMEYVEGSDLKSAILQQSMLPIDRAVAIAESVAEGLDAAHQAGLVHRDIKPQNIMIGPSDRVKITDFGIAKSQLSTAMTETGITFGTADYISPEQAKGQPATHSSDLYSLGVTLYEMLTGRLPFNGESSIAVAMQHVSTEPPPLRMYNPRVPPQLESLVLRALDKNPSERPASAREFAHMLRNYRQVGVQSTTIRPVSSTPLQQPQPVPRSSQPVQRSSQPVRQAPPPGQRVPQSQYMAEPHVAHLPPPRRTSSLRPPPEPHGMSLGTFVLGVFLLAGVFGLGYLFLGTGLLGDLLGSFSINAARPDDTTSPIEGEAVVDGTPTPSPTPEPTVEASVSVPDIVGLEEQEARDMLQDEGLRPRLGSREFSSTVADGRVVSQEPSATTLISETETVTYTLSSGPDIVELRDVTNQRADTAQTRLEQQGFVVQIQQETSASVTEGFVIRQSPFAGARIERGDTVTLVVSVGNRTTMPDVTGLSEDEARRLITEAGLFVSFVDPQGRDRLGDQFDQVPPGTVVSSIPRGGELVERNSGVTLGIRASE
ncbi:MAG: Stk1 family PASTA domain-containing Ser/Thr kinase [Chloroflexota bacterium]